ncbi:thiamine ABC transporter substrate-binding protein [Deinococcus yavapaiensis]|nr:thiamine ABC transporter substrate-binding protein [Deinococcus yavapaiensis]
MLKWLMLMGALASTASAATLTVVTHDSFDLDKALVAKFEREHDAKVRFVKAGDAGAMLSRLILTKNAPIGDVVFGLDNSLLPRAREAGILEPYKSSALANVPAKLHLDPSGLLTTVDYGYVALNYDKAWFEKKKLPLPKTLEDLATARYENLVVVQNPATSSPGLAFLLATVRHFGEDRALKWWSDMRAGGMKITRGWNDAYYTDFTRNGGKYPIVLSYASSPAAEVFYATKKLGDSPTANLLLPGSSFLQLEGVGVLKGTAHRELARAFVDFLLSPAVQADIPTRMWVYPARSGLKLADVYRFAQEPRDATSNVNGAASLVDRFTRTVMRAGR